MNRKKLAIFLLLAGAAALVFVLAAGLNQVELQPGQPFNLSLQPLSESHYVGTSALGGVFLLVVRGLLAISLVLTPVLLIAMLFSERGRKELAALLVITLVILMLVMMVRQAPLEETPAPVPTEEMSAPNLDVGEMGQNDGPVFSADPPEWTTWVASLVVAVVLAGILAGVVLRLRRREPRSALERLAEEAQEALDRIELGEDLRETIVRCYQEMMQVVREARGIVREQHVTPREFEIVLKRKGLPAESLLRLTRLFEEVRYGGQPASQQEEQLAIRCLRDIVAACREGSPREA